MKECIDKNDLKKRIRKAIELLAMADEENDGVSLYDEGQKTAYKDMMRLIDSLPYVELTEDGEV